MRAPAARGLVVLGSSTGRVVLADPRAAFHAEQTLTAHAGGLAGLDTRGDLLATCGFGLRQGMVVLDPFVKVSLCSRAESCATCLIVRGE